MSFMQQRMDHEQTAETLLRAIDENLDQILNVEAVREWAQVAATIALAHTAMAAHIREIESWDMTARYGS